MSHYPQHPTACTRWQFETQSRRSTPSNHSETKQWSEGVGRGNGVGMCLDDAVTCADEPGRRQHRAAAADASSSNLHARRKLSCESTVWWVTLVSWANQGNILMSGTSVPPMMRREELCGRHDESATSRQAQIAARHCIATLWPS